MFYALAVVLVLIADQWLKYWVTLNIELDVGEKALIPGVIKLVNIHNTGAAFGFLKGGDWRWVFVVIAVLFAAAVIYALKKDLIKGKLGRWAAVGVLAGAIGNCIDRVAYGYVVDMFKFEFLGSSRLNAIFNIADVFISCCGVLFCLYIIFGGEKEAADEEYEDEEPARRRSGGSHSKRAQTAKRQPAQRRDARREPVQERTRIPVKEYSPRPAGSRPARPVEPRQVDPNNPFAEWENRPKAPVQPETQQERPQRAQTRAEQPRPAQPRPEPPKPQPQRKPVSDTEFSLEDILAEFSDK
ncbi:MAG TPA: signal peptidase II [Candidatus Scatomorpha pullistercoris]|uniref:Lipoprotein signal peptidase n=1 Tax=Candidatus Scatomorpha pullistercoris TaxID=2840929 RepID=A0A9D1G5U4_9FIRM|nr:signal peptidase II [Candidatus Scatomorpha pullistercoris]